MKEIILRQINKMKKTLLNILLGASLFFVAGNVKSQEFQTYNHDEDEFPEEVIYYKTNETDKKNEIERYTLINYSDEDNDNFYESIRVFNCDMAKKSGGGAHMIIFNIEDFYVDKSTDLINYNWKTCPAFMNKYLEKYLDKKFRDIVKLDDHTKFIGKGFGCSYINRYSGQSLTQETIYSLFPGEWTFYGGFGERVKKIIDAGKDEVELKNLVSNERSIWGEMYK